MAVPYTFGSATTSIPLSQLDSNFATGITLGNTAIQLGNTVTTLNNMTLVTPALGTPSALVLTNATGLPAAQLTGTQTLPKGTLPTGSILQVVSTTKTDGFSIAGSNTFTDITGLTVSITPNFSTSKILIIVNVGAASMNGGGSSAYRLARGGTGIGVGTTAGSRQGASWRDFNGTGDPNASFGGRGFSFLDSPATTSATTYSLQLISENVTGYINISQNDLNTNDPRGTRAASTITVMEISA